MSLASDILAPIMSTAVAHPTAVPTNKDIITRNVGFIACLLLLSVLNDTLQVVNLMFTVSSRRGMYD